MEDPIVAAPAYPGVAKVSIFLPSFLHSENETLVILFTNSVTQIREICG